MDNIYFIIDGIKYIIVYKDNTFEIFTERDNALNKLTIEEENKIKNLLNSKIGDIYYSEKLVQIVNNNDKLEHKDYLLNFLNWLENCIPQELRENFYNNLSTLKTELHLDLILPEDEAKLSYDTGGTVGSYSVRENRIRMNEALLLSTWKTAKTTDNPADFYWKEYSEALLHELAHMASSSYNKETGVRLSGFDKFPPILLRDKNRGLTEGFTELIAMAGVPGTIELASGYYIEVRLINQMIQIIGLDAFQKSYFGNLGTLELEKEFCNLINDTAKAFELFRNIEINYQLGEPKEKQNILGKIQMSLLDYLKKKLEILYAQNDIDSINQILYIYENMIISNEVLDITGKNSKNYDGITESMIRFQEIKESYSKTNKYSNNGILR